MKKTHFEGKTNDMRREQFNSLYYEKAVRCDTKEKAKEFLALADSVGYKWFSGSSLIGRNYWETHEKETYYYVTNCGLVFGNINYIKQNGYQSVEYQPPHNFKVGDKVMIKDTIFAAFNGRVGTITDTGSSILMSHSVKVSCDEWSLWFNIKQLEKVEEPKFKVGDKVKVNNTLKVGVIERVDSSRPLPYAVKIDGYSWLWFLTQSELEKIEEPAYEEETIGDIIEEIKEHQKSINALLNKLEIKVKVK